MLLIKAERKRAPSSDSMISKALRTMAAWDGESAFEKVQGEL